MRREDYLSAARAGVVPEGDSGLWFIRKKTMERNARTFFRNQIVVLPKGVYTHLFRMTTATMHQEPPGEVVMEDTPFELATHVGFMMKAYGRVLVTGLGLGCVVRGVLHNPAVEHVTVVENSKDVLRLVEPYMPKERLTIVQANALEWTKENKQEFDCAWHDVWTDREAGEPHLDRWHVEMMINCRHTVKKQGAWGLDKSIKRVISKKMSLIG